MRTVLCTLVLFLPSFVIAADRLPEAQLEFLSTNCLDCHDAESASGEINLEVSEVDWADRDAALLWERVLDALQSGQMPPEDHSTIAADERAGMVDWIDKTLTRNTPIGGTLARRLNQVEYKATVESLFNLQEFKLPQGFPRDREHHGFDNLGEGLVLSPPLLESYAEAAQLVADRLFPPQQPVPDSQLFEAGADELTISYSSGKVVGDALRLGMKCDPIMRSSTWPTRIEAPASGVYRVKVWLSTFRPDASAGPMIAKVFARDIASKDSISKRDLRLLQEIPVRSESPEPFEFEAELYEGQTPVVHWDNARLDSDREDKQALVEYFEHRDSVTPGYLAAWKAMVADQKQGFRGGVGWERVKALLAEEDLPTITEEERAAFLKQVAGNPVLYAETVVFEVFEQGPALEVHGLEIEGPLRIVDGPKDKERQRLQQQFFGDDRAPEAVIRRFLTRAFRRPVEEATVATYLELYNQHVADGHPTDAAMHLVIRNALISPRFLYRCLQDGPLDDYDLATRLAYFLTGRPADHRLLEKVGMLSDPEVLRSQAERLLPKRADAPLIVNFTGQWLDTRLLSEIMPEQKFGISPDDKQNAISEVEHFFSEMLNKNRPMTDFIDPDFTWTTARIARNVYELDSGFDKQKANAVHRISLARGGRHGGVLGQSAVMMATANGVDTQPVLRGVWVLENILGTPPPPPPKGVPPITPDTTGAKTPRDLLTLHTSDTSCAGCHRKIDPIGLVLENFDPVGRWRETWPDIDQPIDAAATLPDGTAIRNIVDFKLWIVENIDQFSECLAEKLMTYATGRSLNYSERKEIAAIVKRNHGAGNGFRDLVLALIDSETFRTK